MGTKPDYWVWHFKAWKYGLACFGPLGGVDYQTQLNLDLAKGLRFASSVMGRSLGTMVVQMQIYYLFTFKTFIGLLHVKY